jgi:3-deoxy-D-manno-octulosonic acid kinase
MPAASDPAVDRTPVPGIEPVRLATANGALLFDHNRIAPPRAEQLQPQWWAGHGQLDSSRGGRGAVCFLQAPFGNAVLRHYRRGGLIGRVNSDRYLWTGEERTRSFREFRLLSVLRARGLPVPAPVMAGYRRSGTWYRADLMMTAIEHSTTLSCHALDGVAEAGLWRQVGATIAAFHREGVFHADLNAHNILVDRDRQVWLIDFDRGELRTAGGWQGANLLRLKRSLRKIGAAARPGWNAAWNALEAGYRGAQP